jgi:hypothetical protein
MIPPMMYSMLASPRSQSFAGLREGPKQREADHRDKHKEEIHFASADLPQPEGKNRKPAPRKARSGHANVERLTPRA